MESTNQPNTPQTQMKIQQLIAAAFVAALTAGMAPALSAQNTPSPPAAPSAASVANANNAFVSIGGGIYAASIKFEGDSTLNRTLVGGSFGGGVSLIPSDIGRLRVALDLGIYSNSKTTNDGDSDGYNAWADSFKEAYLFVPILASVTYEFDLGSPQFRARAGVVFGSTVVSFETKENWVETAGGDVTNSGAYKFSATSTVFTYGLNVGFTWTPKDSFYVDLNYRFLGNGKAEFDFGGDNTFDMDSNGHLVELSVGWRF
jgi:opacity protein-like surface antigen